MPTARNKYSFFATHQLSLRDKVELEEKENNLLPTNILMGYAKSFKKGKIICYPPIYLWDMRRTGRNGKSFATHKYNYGICEELEEMENNLINNKTVSVP